MRILITGGAGFVGSRLALVYKDKYPAAAVVVLDNLKRRGSEFNLVSFKQRGIDFIHGDIRNQSDLDDIEGNFDFIIEASAEPSVLAGVSSSPNYLLQTNLMGTLNCLEFARKRAQIFVFLSTSRVYSLVPLNQLKLRETPTRFEITGGQKFPGSGAQGVAENFPTHLPRSLYGATKLASELFVQEYTNTYNLQTVINRCGVIAGAGQFGKVDQGVFTLWVANHFFNRPLKYTGFGGRGKQVRDLLHPLDLFALIEKQLASIATCSGDVFNVGGGRAVSTSLLELTALCQEVVGSSIPIQEEAQTSPVDIPLYISDYSKAARAFDWQPQRSVQTIIEEIACWLSANESQLKTIFN